MICLETALSRVSGIFAINGRFRRNTFERFANGVWECPSVGSEPICWILECGENGLVAHPAKFDPDF